MSTAQPERILKELAGLWSGMSKAESKGVNSGVLRACAMTLVVSAKDDADVTEIGNILADLMHEHPSRALVLRPTAEANIFEARVFAQCWMPFGKRQQICCEQVEITASSERIRELPSVIVGIMVPDLPVVLWARNPQWLVSPDFPHLLPLIDKVIIDSATLGPDAFKIIRQLQSYGAIVGDLAWTRLTGPRESISAIFDDQGVIPKFSAVTSIAIEQDGNPLGAIYLASWLKSGAPKATLSIARQTGDSPRVLVKGPDLDIEITTGQTLQVRINQDTHRAMMSPESDCFSMREELSVLTFDPTFDRALAIAESYAPGAS